MSFSYENIFLHLMRTKANKERNITIPRGQSSRCRDWLEGFQGYDNRLGFNYTIYNYIYTIISLKIWDSGTFSTNSWIWGRLQLFPTGEFFDIIEIVFCLNVILLLSLLQTMTYQNCLLPKYYSFAQPSGQTPLLQTPSNHHEPPTVPTRNTNGGSCSRCVLVYKSNVYMFMLNVCVRWYASLMFAPFFDCQVPIFLLPGANIKLSDERRLQMELEEEKPINLRLRKKWEWRYLCTDTIWISVFFSSMGARNVKYIQYRSILIPIKCHIQPKTFQVINKVFF